MKLVHPSLSKPILIQEASNAVLAIENPICLRSMLMDMIAQLNGEDGQFVLSKDNKILKFSAVVELIFDPFQLDHNQRRVLNRVYGDVRSLALDENYYLVSQGLRTQIISFLLKLADELDYGISFDENFLWESLLKAVNFKIDTEGQTVLERVMDYMKVVQLMTNVQLQVFVNLRSYFSQEEISELERFAELEKLNILRIEGGHWDHMASPGGLVIIDEDLCEIRA